MVHAQRAETGSPEIVYEQFEIVGDAVFFGKHRMKPIGNYEYMGWVKFPIFIFKAEKLKKTKSKLEFYEKIKLIKVSKKKAKNIAFNEMKEPHHAFALLKALEN